MRLESSIVWVCLAGFLAGCGGGSSTAPAVKAEPAIAPEVPIQAVARSLGEGKPQAIWSALPARYQSDVKGLITAFADKMDKDVWDKLFVVLGKVAKLAKDKKDFILNHPKMAQGPLADKTKKDQAVKEWDGVVQLLDTLAKSDISTLDRLKKLDVEKFLGETGSKLMDLTKRIAATAGQKKSTSKLDSLKETKVSVVKSEGDTAVLKFEIPGQPSEEMGFTNVDDKWLPTALVDQWDASIKEYSNAIFALNTKGDAKAGMLKVLDQAEGALDELLAAKTQDQFNDSVKKIMENLGPIAALFGFVEESEKDDK